MNFDFLTQNCTLEFKWAIARVKDMWFYEVMAEGVLNSHAKFQEALGGIFRVIVFLVISLYNKTNKK